MPDSYETEGTTGEKYFNVAVPNYAVGATPARDAYLRIGSMSALNDTTQHGATLWGYFEKFLDQSPDGHVRDRSGATTAGDSPVSDATRPPPYGTDDTAANLWNYAGWRDHTDGNRITTTGGDKVEIIRGNYQLLVLGRGPSPDDGVVFDASGGHLVSGDIAPGMVTRIEYKTNKFGGTWKVTEETEKGHVHEVFKGEFKEEFCGSKRTSIVGAVPSEYSGAFAAEGTGNENGAPELLDGTFARSITEYVGSSGTPVASIASTCYATTITDSVTASTVSETRSISTSLTETLTAPSITSNTYASSITEKVGKVDAPCNVDSTHYGNKTDKVYGAIEEITTGAVVDIKIGGLAEVLVGGKVSAVLAREIELIVGAHMEIHAGSFREITLGYKWDLVVGYELEMDDYSTKISAISSKSIASLIFLG